MQRIITHDDFVLSLFAGTKFSARKGYNPYVEEEGCDQGKVEELTGGGLIRSYGGWKNVQEIRRSDSFLKSDERILVESEFVEQVLNDANESEKHQHRLEQLGITESDVRMAASEIIGVAPEALTTKTKERKVVKTRRIYCYWLANDLGISMIKIAELLNISVTTVSKSVS